MKKITKFITAVILTLSVAFCSACISVLPNTSQSDVDAVNGITTKGIIKATFAVYCHQFNASSVPGIEGSQTTSLGSGVIYEAKSIGTDDNPEYEYKLLTNNHVVYHDTSKYNSVDYYVKDYIGNKIIATVLCANPNYDLAVVTFKSENLYPDLDFENGNPEIGTKVIAIGYPLKQINAVTLGAVKEYSGVKVKADENASNVKFNALKHSAYIASGSSGGALLTYSYKICAVNFGAVEDDNDNFEMACAIPVYKIKEYLKLNNAISPEKLGTSVIE